MSPLFGVFMALSQIFYGRDCKILNIFIATQCANVTGAPESRGLAWNGPLIDFGVMQLRESFVGLFNVSHSYLYDNRRPDETQLADDSENFLAKYYYDNVKNADAVVSLACTSRSVIQAARMTKALRMFQMSGLGNGPTQRTHPQFISISVYSARSLFDGWVSLFRLNKWSSISSIIDDRFAPIVPQSRALHEDILARFGTTGYRDLHYMPFHLEVNNSLDDIPRLLNSISGISRVVLIVTTGDRFRDIMIRAHGLNFTNGEFVFLFVMLQRQGMVLAQGQNYTWKRGDGSDRVAFDAYKRVLLASHPVGYPDDPVPNFRERVMEIAASRYRTRYPRDKIPNSLYACYEMILLFGIVANETLQKDGALGDGYTIASQLRNRTFSLPTGNIHIDSDGERSVDTVFGAFDSRSGEFFDAYRYYQQNDSLGPLMDLRPMWSGSDWPLVDPPLCGYKRDRCSASTELRNRTIAIALTVSALLIGASVLFSWMRRRWNPQRSRWWDLSDRILQPDCDFEKQGTQSVDARIGELTTKGSSARVVVLTSGLVVWQSPTCYFQAGSMRNLPKHFVHLLEQLGGLTHDNVNQFVGITCVTGNVSMYEIFCSKGSLEDLISKTGSAQLELKISLIIDLVSGLRYIHRSTFLCHGELTATKCLLDSFFGLKISDLCTRTSSRFRSSNAQEPMAQDVPATKLLFWPPEVLNGLQPCGKTDSYSFAVLAHSILCHSRAFHVRPGNAESESAEIVRNVREFRHPPCRPEFDLSLVQTDFGRELVVLIQALWNDIPVLRPTVDEAYNNIIRIADRHGFTGRKKVSLVERVMDRLAAYAETLETNVVERTSQLLLEKQKCENVLYEIFPIEIMRQLQAGFDVLPEYFESATVCFSSIDGFLDFLELAAPKETSAMLDVIFRSFDAELANYDVFKVETVGDVYMIASGLPVRNGTNHVRQICSTALRLLSAFNSLRTSSRNAVMDLRAGIHTGHADTQHFAWHVPGRLSFQLKCGQDTLRAHRFGDAVNTASRMESHGMAGKIHLSSSTADLTENSGFSVQPRGQMTIKGKGILTTYWLLASYDSL